MIPRLTSRKIVSILGGTSRIEDRVTGLIDGELIYGSTIYWDPVGLEKWIPIAPGKIVVYKPKEGRKVVGICSSNIELLREFRIEGED